MVNTILEQEYDFFLKKRKTLLPANENKFVVIAGGQIAGVYETVSEALKEASQKYQLGTFLIQKISNSEINVVQKFASSVVDFPK
jgi:TRAP-type uncharacterized transport system substrate-binding protein